MPFLTGIDVSGVQRFIFSSNRLRDVVTGSYLVHWSTASDGALKGLVSDAQILLAAGGNAILEFCDVDDAKVFTAQYTRLIHDNVPGLEVMMHHQLFEDGYLAEAIILLQKKLAQKKTSYQPSVPLQGLSVMASCSETGLPAVDDKTTGIKTLLSRNVLRRRECEKKANARWNEYLKDPDFGFPLELEQLGRTIDDTSMMGIVHIDGNGVGKLIKKWLEDQADNRVEDDLVRKEYKEWSVAIDKLGADSLQSVVDRLCQSVNKCVKDGSVIGKPERLGFALKDAATEARYMLPIRPILLGGDDLTFVCDGRIALDLAETALSIFEGEKSKIEHLGTPIRASAGVAIVRIRFPIVRAYQLAEKLCRSAKTKAKEGGENRCAIDWHIGIARPGQTLSDIRRRQYHSGGYDLTCRPYCLGVGKGDDQVSWRWLRQMLLDDESCGLRGAQWSKRRNKAKALAELALDGPAGVKSALQAWQVVNNKLVFPNQLGDNGFIDNSRTPLLDAVELLDLHLVLEKNDDRTGIDQKGAE